MPTARSRDPVTFSMAARVVVGLGGLLLAGLLVTLVAVLATLRDARAEIRTTRAISAHTRGDVRRLTDGLQPVVRATSPLADRATRRAVNRGARDVIGSTRRAAGAASGIADEVRAAALGPSLGQIRDLVPHVAALLAALDAGPGTAAVCDQRLRRDPVSAPGQLACLLRMFPDLRAQLHAVEVRLRRSLAVQRGTRGFNATTVALLQRSLAIQQELLVHTRSLDEKLGGTLPASSP